MVEEVETKEYDESRGVLERLKTWNEEDRAGALCHLTFKPSYHGIRVRYICSLLVYSYLGMALSDAGL